MVVLLLRCAFGIAAAHCAVAAQAPAVAGSPSTATLTAPIGPQALAKALAALTQQTSLQLIYESRLVAGRHSTGAPAGLMVSEALRLLLRGTGLHFEFLNPRTIELVENAPPPAPRPRETRPRSPEIGPLQEIIVTAEKRAENLSAVPISMIVLSGDTLEKVGATRMRDLAQITPGLMFESSSQWGPAIITDVTVRGITSTATVKGTESSIGSPTTGVYIDDVPISMPQSSFSNPYPVTFDLARVEILRGPQGTLFGGRAEGGAVRFITTEPGTASFEGLTSAEVSTTDQGSPSYQLDGAAGGPVVEGLLAARAGVWWRRDGGYVDRIDPLTGTTVDPDANRSTSRAARLAFLITPGAAVRITPSFVYQSTNLHDSPSFFVGLSDPDSGRFRNGKLLRQPASDAFSLTSLKVQATWAAAELTAITSWFDRNATATVDTTNVIGAQFGGFGNPLGAPYPTTYAQAYPTQLGAEQHQFTQEVRLVSRDSAAPVTWLAGMFYSHVYQDTTSGTYSVIAPQLPIILYGTHDTNVDLAGFADVTLHFSRRWRAFGGARVTRARTEVFADAVGMSYPIPGVVHADLKETPLTPRFGLTYEDDPDHILYVSAAKGFRTGGTNPVRPHFCEPTSIHPYAGDSLWSYELGTKDTLLDRRLRIDGSAFYILWRNMQSDAVAPCTYPDIVNAGSATSRGFDLSIDLAATERTNLKLAVSFVDARYSSTASVDGAVIVERGTVIGGALYCQPPWSATLSAEHEMPLGDGLSLYAGGDYIVHSHNRGPFLEGDANSSSYNPVLRSDPATKLLDLRIGLIRGALDVKVSVFNAFDSTPALLREPDLPGSPLYYGQTFRPRTVALSVTQRF